MDYRVFFSVAQYFGATIVLLAISTSLTVLVLNVHYRGTHGQPAPSMVQLVVLNWLARIIGLRKLNAGEHRSQYDINETVWASGKLIFEKGE